MVLAIEQEGTRENQAMADVYNCNFQNCDKFGTKRNAVAKG